MVQFLAFSLQDQVEKYGAYIGIAAFFGLAVLSILYFSQARELRRLRDWAGRAPERAQELEARVVAQADAARRVQAQPIRPAPAAAAAGATAAQPAAGEQATQVIEGDEKEEAAAAQSGNGTAAAAGKATEGEEEAAEPAEGGDGAPPEGEGEPAPTGTEVDQEQGDEQAEPAAAAAGAEDEAPAEQPATAGADAQEPAAAPGEGAPPADAQQPATPGAAAESAPPADADRPAAAPGTEGAPPADAQEPAAAGAGAEGAPPTDAERPAEDQPDADEPAAAEPAPTNGRPVEPPHPGEIPVAPVPRATPLPRRAPAPAAPLRQPSRSTTLPPRRPGPRRAPGPASGSHASRNALIGVGLGVIVLAGIALAATGVIGGGDDPTPPPNTTTEPTAGASPTETALTPANTKVAVLNGTTIGGLASTSADEIRAAGYEGEVTTGNNTDQQRSESEVLYGTRAGARRQASNIARRLDITELGRLDADTRNLSENADVVVILGQDKAP